MTEAPLHLADPQTRADLATFVGRARKMDPEGAIRLQATGTVLAVWVGALKGRGIQGDGTVLGLRVLPLAQAGDLDEVVPLAAVADRLARPGESLELPVPPTRVRTSWAAVSPPRAGWMPVGQVPMDLLVRTAAEGIAQIADGTPPNAGSAAVESLRQRVWGRPMVSGGGADGLPAGVAFGGHALGFLSGQHADVFVSGRWFRVTTAGGHLLVR
ncbi:hypothetical protein ACMYYO_05370 [Dermacoccaceae bacterium W4C1]